MRLDAGEICKLMASAAVPVLGHRVTKMGSYPEEELKKLAVTTCAIEDAVACGKMSQEEAQVLFEMQKSALQSVLLTIEGLERLEAENAINAALAVVKAPVNAALGFALV